jgi:hypothetical protein
MATVFLARQKDGGHSPPSELSQDLVAPDRETTHRIRAHRGDPNPVGAAVASDPANFP